MCERYRTAAEFGRLPPDNTDMLYLFLSASAYTNKLSSLENRVEQLQEELNELKLERGNSVRSVFDKFDADESNSLSMSEFKSMVTAGAVSLAADEDAGGDCMSKCISEGMSAAECHEMCALPAKK